jgi:hypothetical protein
MNKEKNRNCFVSVLLLAFMIAASINLIGCGNNSDPTIYSLSPNATTASSTAGTVTPTSVTLIGANFGTTQGAQSHVYFNNVDSGTASSWSDTSIVATIPSVAPGLTTGTSFTVPVVVSVSGQVSNAVTFTYIVS